MKNQFKREEVISVLKELLQRPEILIDAVQNEESNYDARCLLELGEAFVFRTCPTCCHTGSIPHDDCKICEGSGLVYREEILEDFQTCESCEKKFDLDIMTPDDDCNWFCPDCWKELAPVMKAEYDELVKRGEVDPEEIETTEDLLEIIDYWSSKYEFNFQFWGDDTNHVNIEKGGVDLYSSYNHEKPIDAMKAALEYIHKINRELILRESASKSAPSAGNPTQPQTNS